MEPDMRILLHAIVIELQTMNDLNMAALAYQSEMISEADFRGWLKGIEVGTPQKYTNMGVSRKKL